jgi:hypothetical protein
MGTNGAEGVVMNRWLGYAFKFNFRLKFRWIIRHIQRAASSGTGASDAFGEEIILNELDDYENKISCRGLYLLQQRNGANCRHSKASSHSAKTAGGSEVPDGHRSIPKQSEQCNRNAGGLIF